MPQITDKVSEEIKQAVAAEVARVQKESVPHICTYCSYFQLSKTPPTNRFCQYKGMLQVDKGRCLNWVLTDDWQDRRVGDITV